MGVAIFLRLIMGRKSSFTEEQLRQIHSEMVSNNWNVREAAEMNTVIKLQKMTLYMALKRIGLTTRKDKKVAA